MLWQMRYIQIVIRIRNPELFNSSRSQKTTPEMTLKKSRRKAMPSIRLCSSSPRTLILILIHLIATTLDQIVHLERLLHQSSIVKQPSSMLHPY